MKRELVTKMKRPPEVSLTAANASNPGADRCIVAIVTANYYTDYRWLRNSLRAKDSTH